MARSTYASVELGHEVATPSGYYQPLEEGYVDYEGKRVLYTLGRACIEASCCGVGDWRYARVEGYVVDDPAGRIRVDTGPVEIETIESESDRASIGRLLEEKHPGVQIEFR